MKIDVITKDWKPIETIERDFGQGLKKERSGLFRKCLVKALYNGIWYNVQRYCLKGGGVIYNIVVKKAEKVKNDQK